ncbi:MAG TPA: sulfotransferase, partial [Rhodothermales bacterium]|nr:sulfotransferase [Rhodothermales bacterium]
SLQRPHFRNLKPYVYRAFHRMYDAFEQQREQLADNQITDIRYEDLIQDPVSVMERTYAHLELGEFETVRERMEKYAGDQRSYKTNTYDLTDEYREEILQHWGRYAERYGYVEQA